MEHPILQPGLITKFLNHKTNPVYQVFTSIEEREKKDDFGPFYHSVLLFYSNLDKKLTETDCALAIGEDVEARIKSRKTSFLEEEEFQEIVGKIPPVSTIHKKECSQDNCSTCETFKISDLNNLNYHRENKYLENLK